MKKQFARHVFVQMIIKMCNQNGTFSDIKVNDKFKLYQAVTRSIANSTNDF